MSGNSEPAITIARGGCRAAYVSPFIIQRAGLVALNENRPDISRGVPEKATNDALRITFVKGGIEELECVIGLAKIEHFK